VACQLGLHLVVSDVVNLDGEVVHPDGDDVVVVRVEGEDRGGGGRGHEHGHHLGGGRGCFINDMTRDCKKLKITPKGREGIVRVRGTGGVGYDRQLGGQKDCVTEPGEEIREGQQN
jgi:hypothetical protein